MSDKAHSHYGPSSLPRRAACPGSGRMEKGRPDSFSSEAQKGTDKHAIMERLIKAPKDAILEIFEELSNDAETCEEISFCWEFFEKLPKEGWRALPEYKLDCTKIHPAIEFGTADLVLAQPFSRVVVVDWKFGHGAVEPASENVQLAALAAAAAKEFEANEAHVYVVQPPLCRITSHVYTDFDSLDFALRMIVEACLKDNAPTIPSESACKYCKAKADCPSLRALTAELVLVPTAELQQLTNMQMGMLLQKCEAVEDFCGLVKQQAYARAVQGSVPEGYELKAGKRSRAWIEEDAGKLEASLRALADQMKQIQDAIYAERKLATVAQLEERFKGVEGWKDALGKLWAWRDGAPRLSRKARK